MELFTYLERRQLGYEGLRKNVKDIFIEQLGCKIKKKDACSVCHCVIELGCTFACKFSRNKNNLQTIGCSAELGIMVIGYPIRESYDFVKFGVHSDTIFDFAWAEPQMKLVTACGDKTSKLCDLQTSGALDEVQDFNNDSPVKSVMFRPGSSDVFCVGCMDGSIKIWDARMNNEFGVMTIDCNVPNAHGVYSSVYKNKMKISKPCGISSVIYKTDYTVLSSSTADPCIKLWDLRKSSHQVKGNTESLSLITYFHNNLYPLSDIGYADMVINSQSTHLYASGTNNVIYCYLLESPERKPLCEYSGHVHETSYSKISVSNDGRYLFSGCTVNTGVLWLTEPPYNNNPVFTVTNNTPFNPKELSGSDWCADSSLKLAVSSDSMPMIFSIQPFEQDVTHLDFIFDRTASYEPKSLSKIYTAPIKSELKKKFLKETEENMDIWDFQNQNKVSTAVDNKLVIPKRQLEVVFTDTLPTSQISPQLDTTLIQSSPVVPNQISDVVEPVSNKKQKISLLSPGN